MELLETQDPERKKLIETSERHRRELENEFSEISMKTERIFTNALIIGGSLALTYLLVNQLTSKSKKVKKAKIESRHVEQGKQSEEDQPSALKSALVDIGGKFMDRATIMILDIAREKLTEYLQSRKREDS